MKKGLIARQLEQIRQDAREERRAEREMIKFGQDETDRQERKEALLNSLAEIRVFHATTPRCVSCGERNNFRYGVDGNPRCEVCRRG